MFKNAAEAIKYIRENDIEFVDVRFMDLPGVMQHFNIPACSPLRLSRPKFGGRSPVRRFVRGRSRSLGATSSEQHRAHRCTRRIRWFW